MHERDNWLMQPKKKATLKANRRLYIHYYYNANQAAEKEKALDKTLIGLKRELQSDHHIAEHEPMYATYFKKQKKDTGLFKKHTLQGLLDKLDVIECFETPGQRMRIGEILEKQKDIYRCLDIDAPSSL